MKFDDFLKHSISELTACSGVVDPALFKVNLKIFKVDLDLWNFTRKLILANIYACANLQTMEIQIKKLWRNSTNFLLSPRSCLFIKFSICMDLIIVRTGGSNVCEPPPPRKITKKVRVQRSGIDTIKYHTWPRIPMGKWHTHSYRPQTRAKTSAFCQQITTRHK